MSIFNRAEIVDQNFRAKVAKGEFPFSATDESAIRNYPPHVLVDVFESQVMSRHADLSARRLRERAASFYTIGSSGHEGNAAVAKMTSPQDMAFLHYRSGAFFMQRAKQYPGSTPLYDMMLSLVASADDPISGGRHKVLGSVELNIPPQTSTIASHLPKAVGTALSIQRAKLMNLDSHLASDSIVICNFGDASANHSVALTAFNMASWCAYQSLPLPLLFVCEDNGIGISTPTPDGWIEQSFRNRVGLHYLYCDGLNMVDSLRQTEVAVRIARKKRQPVFLHMKTVRLLGHAGSDIESMYNTTRNIETTESNDPLMHSARILVENHILSREDILNMYDSMRRRIDRVGEIAIMRPKLLTAKEVVASVIPPMKVEKSRPFPDEDTRKEAFGGDWKQLESKHHMARLINLGLVDQLLQYPEMILFGEDVARKGGVYNVTAGLWKKFGSRRVFNTPLDETSILGAAVGYAHNKFIPVPEIQFLAYVHNAEDQIRGEASTLSFFSEGQFTNPMVVRIPGLAYQKGFGGHFHNDNSLAIFRDIPGVIVVCPSNGYDAVRLMRTCMDLAYRQGRVCIFVEPIALYMTKDLLAPDDGLWTFPYPVATDSASFGDPIVHGKGDEVCIVTYGNGHYLSQQAVAKLGGDYKDAVKIIDIPWLWNTDKTKLMNAIGDSRRVLIVDECRKTGSFSEGLVTDIVEYYSEHHKPLPHLQRLTADDCFIPLGVAATVVLPSCDGIMGALQNMMQKENGQSKPSENRA